MLILAILVALVVFCLVLAIYNYSQKDNIEVSRRIGDYAKAPQKRKRPRGDFWQDLKESKLRNWAAIIAERFGDALPKQKHFAEMVERAGIPISGNEFIVLLAGSTVFWFVFVAVLMLNPLKAVFYSGLWAAMFYFYVQYMGNSRLKDFDAQLGDAIVMMNNALRAGFTFQQAMDTVAKELPDPMSGEFSRALREIQLGVPLEEALNGISYRMKSDDFDLLATAVIIQRQVGGNLSQILETIGTTIRDRVKLKREVKVLTAEGVMAGWTVGLMPFFVCFLVVYINPNYFDEFLAQSYAKYIIIFCIISEIIGGFVIRKIVDVKV